VARADHIPVHGPRDAAEDNLRQEVRGAVVRAVREVMCWPGAGNPSWAQYKRKTITNFVIFKKILGGSNYFLTFWVAVNYIIYNNIKISRNFSG
jgi:hypothetical protein